MNRKSPPSCMYRVVLEDGFKNEFTAFVVAKNADVAVSRAREAADQEAGLAYPVLKSVDQVQVPDEGVFVAVISLRDLWIRDPISVQPELPATSED